MNKTKALMTVLVLGVVAIFSVAMWSALSSGNDGAASEGTKALEQKTVIEPGLDSMKPAAMEPATSIVEDDMAAEPDVATLAETDVVEDVAVADESASAAEVAVHEVLAQVTAFSPLVIFIQPGDLVAWSNMNGHDTKSLEGLIPEGAEGWHSKLGENYQRTFTVEGVYLYKCTPHFGVGMGGVIVVGNPTNFDDILASNQKGAAKRLVKKAKAAIEAHTF